ALSRAAAAPSLVAAPPLVLAEADADCDAVALARLSAVLGDASRAEDLAARAAGRASTCASASFVAATLTLLGAASVEVAGDAARRPLARAGRGGASVERARRARRGAGVARRRRALRGMDRVPRRGREGRREAGDRGRVVPPIVLDRARPRRRALRQDGRRRG